MALSMDEMERAFHEAKDGKASSLPFSDGCIPTVFDKTLAPEGVHVMSLFTQWVPHEWSEEPHSEELEAYADLSGSVDQNPVLMDCYRATRRWRKVEELCGSDQSFGEDVELLRRMLES